MEASMSTDMGGEAASAVSKVTGWRRLLRRIGYGVLALGVLILLADVAWKASGSSEWTLHVDEGGVKVWTQKVPGSSLIKVKSQARIKSNLGGMVKLLEDLESCADAFCYDTKVLRQMDTMPGNYGKYVRFKFDIPMPGFKPRDYVLFAEHLQDPRTKKLEINIMAAPDVIPRDDCCVRVTHLHNNWKLTPLKNNELDIEFTQDTDIGGMPYPLANMALTWGMHKVLVDMQEMMNRPRYKNAQVDYIQELEAS